MQQWNLISTNGIKIIPIAVFPCQPTWPKQERMTEMSVKGEIKEAAGFIKEEAHEHGKSPASQAKAQEGRNLRNEGRVEDGKAPKTTKPGTGHPEK
jgi:hypothetical protein